MGDEKASRSPGSRFGHRIMFTILRTAPKTLRPQPSSPNMRRQLALVGSNGETGMQMCSW